MVLEVDAGVPEPPPKSPPVFPELLGKMLPVPAPPPELEPKMLGGVPVAVPATGVDPVLPNIDGFCAVLEVPNRLLLAG